MTLYLLNKWEENGYDDSDFYAGVYNDETGNVEFVMTGTTRAASIGNGPVFEPVNEEIARLAIEWLTDHIFYALKTAEIKDVETPNDVEVGTRVRLSKAHRNMAKKTTTEDCRKCNGSGDWVNPRSNKDIRECFTCNGEGKHTINGDKIKDRNGRQVYHKFAVGLAGKVVWVGTFRKIWSRGYNKRNRETLSTKIKLDDGQIINVPLKKLKLDKELSPDSNLMAKAQHLAKDCQFGAALSSKFAWDSQNFVKGKFVK